MIDSCGLTLVVGLKGGVGKSSVVLSLYNHFTAQGFSFGVISNDLITDVIQKIVGSDSFYRIPTGAKFPDVESTDNYIFDFGGFPDSRARDVLGKAKNILLPTLGDRVSIDGCVETLKQIHHLTEARIAVVGSRVSDGELEALDEIFEEFPIFRFKHSMGVPNMFAYEKSFEEQIAERPILGISYSGVLKDVKNIASWLIDDRADQVLISEKQQDLIDFLSAMPESRLANAVSARLKRLERRQGKSESTKIHELVEEAQRGAFT